MVVFLQLPEEIIVSIFSRLSHHELLALSEVNKACRSLAMDEQVWREVLFYHLNIKISGHIVPPKSKIAGSSSWVDIYKHWIKFPQALMQREADYSDVEVFLDSASRDTISTYVPLPQKTRETIIHLEAVLNTEIDENNKKQIIIDLMRNLPQDPLPKPCNYYFRFRETSTVYYEITAFHKEVFFEQNGFGVIAPEAIGIGLVLDSQKPLRTTAFPGWQIGTVGYHSDDGKLFLSTGMGHHTEERWGPGDVAGCGYDIAAREIFFTRNGELIASVPDHYVIGFSQNEAISAMISVDSVVTVVMNFGQIPFLYCPYSPRDPMKNIATRAREVKKREMLSLAAFAFDPDESSSSSYSDIDEDDDAEDMIFEY